MTREAVARALTPHVEALLAHIPYGEDVTDGVPGGAAYRTALAMADTALATIEGGQV